MEKTPSLLFYGPGVCSSAVSGRTAVPIRSWPVFLADRSGIVPSVRCAIYSRRKGFRAAAMWFTVAGSFTFTFLLPLYFARGARHVVPLGENCSSFSPAGSFRYDGAPFGFGVVIRLAAARARKSEKTEIERGDSFLFSSRLVSRSPK